MTGRTTFLRWLPTFLAFPLGGLLAVTLVGSVTDPFRAGLAGAVAGAVLGAAQWLALRPTGLGPAWAGVTALGVAAGSVLAAALTGAATSPPALILTGAVTGTVLGAGQALLVRGGWLVGAAWTGLVGLAWALGWLVTANVILDADRGYVVFGSSGALLATLLTGLLLRRLVVLPVAAHRPVTPPAGEGVRA